MVYSYFTVFTRHIYNVRSGCVSHPYYVSKKKSIIDFFLSSHFVVALVYIPIK